MRLALVGLLLLSLAAGCADDVDIQSMPGHEQCFVVVDERIRPIEGASITLYAGPGSNDRQAFTDADGAACIDGLEPGTYFAEVASDTDQVQVSFEVPSDAVVRVVLRL